MTAAQRQFVRAQVAAAAIVNFALNGGVAWLTARGAPPAPVWAKGPCVGFEIVGMSFFLPLVTCLVLTTIVRGLGKKGKAPALDAPPRTWRWLPASTLGRGALLGLASALAIGPAVASALQAAGLALMTAMQVVWLKGLYGAALGALVTVPITAWALVPATAARARSPGAPSAGGR